MCKNVETQLFSIQFRSLNIQNPNSEISWNYSQTQDCNMMLTHSSFLDRTKLNSGPEIHISLKEAYAALRSIKVRSCSCKLNLVKTMA